MNSFFAYLCSFFLSGPTPTTLDLSKPLPVIQTSNNACLPGEEAIIDLLLTDSGLISTLKKTSSFITIPHGGTNIGCCGIITHIHAGEQGYHLTGKLVERVRCRAFTDNTALGRAWPLSFNAKKHSALLALLITELRDEALIFDEARQKSMEQKLKELLAHKPNAAFYIASLYGEKSLLSTAHKRELLEAPSLLLMLKMMVHFLHHQEQEASYPPEVQEALNTLKNELNAAPANSHEHALIKKRYDLIKQFPTSKDAPHPHDLNAMREILDSAHLGMKPLKERMLDYLAVLTANPNIKLPILCLAGPAGVGKTTIAQSIAHALNRPFFRISLGGLHDESLLRGSSPSYVGAQAGRPAMALIKTHSFAPLILLDEIDKIATEGGTNGGSPEAALLELLDHAQNNAFYDNYLGFGIDLSRALFIATANDLGKLQRPLQDRMEIIMVPGYSSAEKMQILRTILYPEQCKEYGLDPAKVQFDERALDTLVKNATEPGMRRLQQLVRRICAKLARLTLEKKQLPPLNASYMLQLIKEVS